LGLGSFFPSLHDFCKKRQVAADVGGLERKQKQIENVAGKFVSEKITRIKVAFTLAKFSWRKRTQQSHFSCRVYIGEVYRKCRRHLQATLTIVLALATLGGAKQIGLFLFPPKVTKARTYSVAVGNIFTKITSPM
jgi:hypothetical protein